MMRITVEYYGVLSRLMGTERQTLQPAGSTVAELLEQLSHDNPQLREMLPRLACAIDDDLVSRDHLLAEDCILALIPPVSGGSQ